MGVQTYSLFNVAGLIDKDKNIYYVPQPELLYESRGDFDEVVADSYYTLFKSVCPPSSSYTDKSISDWSPEDRRLVVEGTIDNFRLSRGGGLALNYCIVYRYVSNISSYTGFFITSVRQLGVNSVELMLEPDHFTNFFYLQNTEEITRNYDPFNPVMRNCYVERQHYDRGHFEDDLWYPDNSTFFVNYPETFSYKFQWRPYRHMLPLFTTTDINLQEMNELYYELKSVTTQNQLANYINRLNNEGREDLLKCIASIFVKYINIQYKEYKAINSIWVANGQTTKTYAICVAGNSIDKEGNVASQVIHIVKPVIDIPKELSNIKKEWLRIDGEFDFDYGDNHYNNFITLDSGITDSYTKYGYLGGYLGSQQYVLSSFITKHSPLAKQIIGFKNNSNLTFSIRFRLEDPFIYHNENYLQNVEAGKGFSFKKYRNEVLPQQMIINDSAMLVTIPLQSDIINFDTEDDSIKNDPYLYIDEVENIIAGYSDEHLYSPNSRWGFIIGKYENTDMALSFSDNEGSVPDLINDYYEPLLESEPYSFYSLSLYENETPLNKHRYYQNFDIDENKYYVDLITNVSYNDAYKIGVIPVYALYGQKQIYYSEALVMTLPSGLTIVESSYFNYYLQNKAQMKSQYAINSVNYEYANKATAITGASNTLKGTLTGGIKAGGTGTIAGLVGGVVDTARDFALNTLEYSKSNDITEIQQKAKLSDVGAKPDTVRQAGSDIVYELSISDLGVHYNFYTIDTISYINISRLLERTGYKVDLFDELNPFNRVVLNYIKLIGFDFVEDNIKISVEQSNAISSIFMKGVTLLHDKEKFHELGNRTVHNYEKILEGGDN